MHRISLHYSTLYRIAGLDFDPVNWTTSKMLPPWAQTTMLELAILLVWNCLAGADPAIKNPIFSVVFPKRTVLEQLFTASNFAFADGLLDVVQSTTPPSIAFFKSLPRAALNQVWGVYVLVLEKPGYRPKIYVGSGTDSQRGVLARWSGYDNGTLLPRLVQAAINDGYTIVYKGLLGWTAIPVASKRFLTRVLILALEATFAFLFWAMSSKGADYCMSHAFFWNFEALDYDGCCSHSPLRDIVIGQADGLTLDEIAQKDAAAEVLRPLLKKAAARRTLRKLKATNYEAWKARQLRSAALRDPVKKALSKKTTRETNLASNKYTCHVCGTKFTQQTDLNLHYETQKHIDAAAGVVKEKNPSVERRHANNIASKKYYCEVCDAAFKTQQKLDNHLDTDKHKKKAAN